MASNMGAGVFPLYLIPLNTAQKLTYALFFLLAQQQASSSRGMTIFCALLCLYRMGLMLFSPATQFLGEDGLGLTPDETRYLIVVFGAAILLAYAFVSLLQLAKESNGSKAEIDTDTRSVSDGSRSPIAPEDIERYKAIAFTYYCSEKYQLTNREAEIALLLEKGGNVKSIAEQLVISQGTAKAHVRNTYAKLGVHSKEEAVAELIQARKEFFG